MKTTLFVLSMLAALLLPGAAFGDEDLERALSLATEQRYPEAREALRPVLQREPGHPRALLLKGVLDAREGRAEEAIEVFEALRREHPGMIEPYNNLAVLYAVTGRLETAREILLETLTQWPDAVVYANLGDVYTKLAHRAYEHAQEMGTGGEAPVDRELDTTFAISAEPEDSSGATSRSVAAAPSTDSPVDSSTDSSVVPAVVPATLAQDAASDSREAANEAQAPAVPEPPDAAAVGTASAGLALASPSAGFCAQAGGFGSRRDVATAALWLQSYGAEVIEVRHEKRQQTASLYQVYLPPLETRAEAVAMLREIRKGGVRDVAVIQDGQLANGISFGVFRKAENVRRRVATLDLLGYAVQSRAKGAESAGGYTIRTHADGAPAALDAAWTSRFPEQALQVIDCG